MQKEIRSQIGRAAAAFTSLNKIRLLKISILEAKSAAPRPNYESSTQMLFPSEHMDMKPGHPPEAQRQATSSFERKRLRNAQWNENMKWNGFVTNVRGYRAPLYLWQKKWVHLRYMPIVKASIHPIRDATGSNGCVGLTVQLDQTLLGDARAAQGWMCMTALPAAAETRWQARFCQTLV